MSMNLKAKEIFEELKGRKEFVLFVVEMPFVYSKTKEGWECSDSSQPKISTFELCNRIAQISKIHEVEVVPYFWKELK